MQLSMILVRHLRKKRARLLESNLNLQVFCQGEAYFIALEDRLRSARKEIFLESYIFNYDKIGQEILLLLQEAVLRGVQVRLMVDGVGSLGSIRDLADFCRLAGIAFAVYHPLPLQSHLIFSKHVIARHSFMKRLAMFGRMNKRNHRKVIVIDGQIVFLGSLNIADSYKSGPHGLAWRETGLLAEGSDVQHIRGELLTSWDRALGLLAYLRRRPRELPAWLRLNSNLRWRRRMKKQLISLIDDAERRIYITTPYFVPRPSLMLRLIRAAERGVDVQILLPEANDVWVVKYASLAFYKEILHHGIRIWEYQPGVLHAKTIIIDDRGIIGSQNFNHRSFLHDLEIEIMSRDASVVSTLDQQWQEDLKHSACAKQSLSRLRFVDRILAWFFLRFRYWL